MRTAKTLMRLGWCPGWSESSRAHTHCVGFVMSRLIFFRPCALTLKKYVWTFPLSGAVPSSFELCLINYTPSIYAEGYIVFAFPFVRSLRSWNLPQRFPQKCVKDSQVGYISRTNQKAFIFGPWVVWKVCFLSMSFCPRVHAPGWGWRSKSRSHLESVFLLFCYWNNLCR